MTHKLQIKWDNSNPVFESIRIYKSGSVFTKNTLPALFAEITDIAASSYEDLDVELNETWFYMLSTKLGGIEVFTECFEVLIVNDVLNTLNIQYKFAFSAIDIEWNALNGEFRAHKGSIAPTTSTNSAKIYANQYRKTADGNFYYEIICKKVLNNSGVIQSSYTQDNFFGLMQEGASININSSDSSGGVYFSNEGYGRYIFRNASDSIQCAGGNLTTAGAWVTKVSGKQLQVNQVWGVGIRGSGSNTLVELWLDGVYQGVMFTISGKSINFAPLVIFTLETSAQKSTHYISPRTLSFLPDGYNSWLTAS